ncbi:hypothetical protein IFM89_024079 [Coptis chinensis]|uniref:Uncharacterized protein n=1 Tax=Coptis chinensis TaxID=261450 RepID=A0A835HXN6_9MAGN|nr:hypothetical protein IFM89_024079 [Coptis chinensis]
MGSSSEIEEWEAKVRVWLSVLADKKNVNVNQIEAWINSNQVSLPQQLQSLPRPQLYQKVFLLNNSMQLQLQQNLQLSLQEKSTVERQPARFQRTDQWIPVYAWLESLDKDEVVKSKEISDWLDDNPSVRDKLFSRHSRYHLMHYVQKCHVKILKRRGKLPTKGSESVPRDKFAPQSVVAPQVSRPSSAQVPAKVNHNVVPTAAVPLSGTSSTNLLKNKDVSLVRQTDELFRYQLSMGQEQHKDLVAVFTLEEPLVLKGRKHAIERNQTGKWDG